MGSPAEPASSVWLSELTEPLVRAYLERHDTVLVPVGSTEQHAEHLPLGVDALSCIRLAEDAAERTGTLVAPPLWYGWAPQHMGGRGSVTLRAETLTNMVVEIGESLTYHGFRRIVLVNGNRVANLPPLSVAATRLRHRTHALVLVVDPVWLAKELLEQWEADPDFGGLGHADATETGLMLHLFPTLVDRPAIPGRSANVRPDFCEPDPLAPGDRAAYWPSPGGPPPTAPGYDGNPGWGTAERGATLHQTLVDNLARLIVAIQDSPVDLREGEYPA